MFPNGNRTGMCLALHFHQLANMPPGPGIRGLATGSPAIARAGFPHVAEAGLAAMEQPRALEALEKELPNERYDF